MRSRNLLLAIQFLRRSKNIFDEEQTFFLSAVFDDAPDYSYHQCHSPEVRLR
ncbi:MAG: hypothetical protein WBF90_32480 [Rivularia sp. (in: cyanobacteria)]